LAIFFVPLLDAIVSLESRNPREHNVLLLFQSFLPLLTKLCKDSCSMFLPYLIRMINHNPETSSSINVLQALYQLSQTHAQEISVFNSQIARWIKKKLERYLWTQSCLILSASFKYNPDPVLELIPHFGQRIDNGINSIATLHGLLLEIVLLFPRSLIPLIPSLASNRRNTTYSPLIFILFSHLAKDEQVCDQLEFLLEEFENNVSELRLQAVSFYGCDLVVSLALHNPSLIPRGLQLLVEVSKGRNSPMLSVILSKFKILAKNKSTPKSSLEPFIPDLHQWMNGEDPIAQEIAADILRYMDGNDLDSLILRMKTMELKALQNSERMESVASNFQQMQTSTTKYRDGIKQEMENMSRKVESLGKEFSETKSFVDDKIGEMREMLETLNKLMTIAMKTKQ